MTAPGTIDGYLDALLASLAVDPGRARRILAEVEDHLRASASSLETGGMPPAEAEREAIARFGPPARLARELGGVAPRSLRRLGIEAVTTLALTAGIGLVAIGVSGVLSQLLGAAFGKSFIAGDTNGVTYTAARCADFLRFHPEAPDCAAAATAHHFDEVAQYREAAGVLGLAVLGGWWLVRRRASRRRGLLPAVFEPTVGAALFGLAALGLLGLSLGQIAFGDTTGTGAYLTGGAVSAIVFAAYAARLLRAIGPPPLETARPIE